MYDVQRVPSNYPANRRFIADGFAHVGRLVQPADSPLDTA